MSSSFHMIPAVRDTPLFIFGDHASKHIPDEFDDLGLSGDDLTRHIAWDIGTETIIRHLCAHFGCGGQLAGVSRLVIDYNRELGRVGMIPETSDGTAIPANQGLSEAQINARVSQYYNPYHTALGQALDDMQQSDPLVISVHSFTPKPETGKQRLLDIGLLVKDDEFTAKQFRAMVMRAGRHFTIAMNEPYSAYDLNHTIDAHVGPRGLRHLAIEVRQDHIDSENKALDMARLLADWLEPIVSRADITLIEP